MRSRETAGGMRPDAEGKTDTSAPRAPPWARIAGDRPPTGSVLPASRVSRYHSLRFRVHLGNPGSIKMTAEQLTVQRKILIMGLPGAGKTTLANALAPRLNAVVFNADAVRANLSRDLGFGHEDRVEHARRMGWMCDRVVEAGGTVIADFICPTPYTRAPSATPSPFGSTASTPAASRTPTGCLSAPERFDLRVGRGRDAAILGRTGAGAAATGI